MNLYEIDVRNIKGVGDVKAKQLLRLGISSVGDLLTHYPVRFEDRTEVTPVTNLSDGSMACVTGIVTSSVSESYIRKGLISYKFTVSDDSGSMCCTFFNNKYIKSYLRPGAEYSFWGKVFKKGRKAEMTPSEFEESSLSFCTKNIVPVYPLTSGISQKFMRSIVMEALKEYSGYIEENIPYEIKEKYELCGKEFSVLNIHFPHDAKSLEISRKRLVFEEFFILQISLRRMKSLCKKETGIHFSNTDISPLLSKLSFSLTFAQRRAVQDIINDFSCGYRMNRLIQGDVGSGKTVVAACAMFLAAKNGYQSAMMAPTEVLASQHYNDLSPLLEDCGFRCALLTGSKTPKQKEYIYKGLKNGDIDIIFGTHALLTDKVVFANAALAITDEQHRFGVRQRAVLSEKGGHYIHTLVMTATPIPRTLALIMYGDMDISVIDELPPGRQKIDTFCINESLRERLYGFIRKEISAGNRVYIVCPGVEDGEDSAVKSVNSMYKELKEKVFPDIPIGIVHGKMRPAEKEKAMADFSAGATKILTSTTVIEIGINVPEATLMIVENAERFGLSQLHQLRGRVGRGKTKSYCVLICDTYSEDTKKRMEIMTKSDDGFKISEKDLVIRGPGDFFGTRQHGIPPLKIANLADNMETLKKTSIAAEYILNQDFQLELPQNAALRRYTDKLTYKLSL